MRENMKLIELIADQKKEIQSLREEIQGLKEYIKILVIKRIFKRG